MAGNSRAIADLQKLLQTPGVSSIKVRGMVVGQVTIHAALPNGHSTITIPGFSPVAVAVNLLDYAGVNVWRNCESLRQLVAKGHLQIVKEKQE